MSSRVVRIGNATSASLALLHNIPAIYFHVYQSSIRVTPPVMPNPCRRCPASLPPRSRAQDLQPPKTGCQVPNQSFAASPRLLVGHVLFRGRSSLPTYRPPHSASLRMQSQKLRHPEWPTSHFTSPTALFRTSWINQELPGATLTKPGQIEPHPDRFEYLKPQNLVLSNRFAHRPRFFPQHERPTTQSAHRPHPPGLGSPRTDPLPSPEVHPRSRLPGPARS